jgi:hypothetical protein
VAAGRVRLLDLQPLDGSDASDGGADPGSAATLPVAWVATLALTRRQATTLIRAENYAREIRLLSAP